MLGEPLPDDVLVLPTVDQVADRCTVAVDSEPPPTPRVDPVDNGDYAERFRQRVARGAWGLEPEGGEAP